MIDFVKGKEIKIIRDNVKDKAQQLLRNKTWCMRWDFLGRRYQCLITDKISFATYSEVAPNDRYNINKKISDIKKEIDDLCFPENTLLLGTLYHDDFNLLTKIVTADTATALSLLKHHKINYIVTDVLYFDSIDLRYKPFSERLEILEALFDDVEASHVKLAEHFFDLSDKKTCLKQAAIDKRSVIFASTLETYMVSKLYKYNNPNYYYAIIMDVNIRNQVAYSVTVGMYKNNQITEVGNATGITKQLALQLTLKSDDYIGKIVKVSARMKCKSKLKNPKIEEIISDEDYDEMLSLCRWDLE